MFAHHTTPRRSPAWSKLLGILALCFGCLATPTAQTKKLPQADRKMLEAYRISGKIIADRIKHENGHAAESLTAGMTTNDLVVIDGDFDHIHLVLSALELPFTRVTHEELPAFRLEPHQTVFVNCASSFPAGQARRLATFVAQGGQLITTDWALKYVLETGFPGYVGGNGRYTNDDVVRIEPADTLDPVVKGFLDEETQPVWWLEGVSYPIRILNREKVTVLIRSAELRNRYGEEAVLVRFRHGKGVVYHMISHFYLQRTELRETKHEQNAEKYLIVKSRTRANELSRQAAGLSYGQVQAANTSAEFIMRAVLEHRKRIATKQP